MSQQRLLDDLLKDLEKGNVLLVVGTGVPIQATGNQPCASWAGLILDGIDHCEGIGFLPHDEAEALRAQLKKKDVDVGKLLEVAEKVSETLKAHGEGEFRLWLQKSVGQLELRHRDVIDAIHDLGVPMATTNYDNLLTRGRGIEAVPWTAVAAAQEVIRGDRSGVLHFHGYYDDPPSVVLGVRSYQKLLESQGAQAIQRAVAANKTLLFIGSGDGLTDPNFGTLLEWIGETFGDSIYRHYCLCREGERETRQKLYPPGKRLSFLSYGDDYPRLAPFIRDTLGPVAKLRRPRPYPPLPPRPAYCIGREREIEDVVSALLEDSPRPLPLLGGPGMGKTTIALTALHDKRVAERFGSRRWFVRCDGVKNRVELTAVTATALGLTISPTVEQAVLSALEAGPGVLVIDNAETPLDADRKAVENVLTILGAIEHLALIVTIRGQTRPRGVPWRTSLEATRLSESAARELFVEVSGHSSFANDPDLRQLLRALDGVALAITLMARYAEVHTTLEPVWSVWSERRTAMLHDGADATRETDIAVSYELSIGALSSEGRRLLTVLAMLPNGVALIDLNTVFPGSEDPAHELRARALVFEEDKRLRMPAPLREHVTATRAPDSTDAQTAVEHYVSLALNEGNKLGRAGGGEAVARLAPEVANVEHLLARSAVIPSKVPAAKATIGWAKFMRFTGLGSMSLIEKIAGQQLSAGMTKDAAASFENLGGIALARSDHDTARKRYEEALPLYKTSDDLLGEAHCVAGLGDIALSRSDLKTAEKRYEEALPLFQRMGDLLGEANCIQRLGSIALERSDYDTARRLYEKAMPLSRRIGDLLGEANCIQRLANIDFESENYDAAQGSFEKAVELFQRVGSGRGEANCLLSLGDIALERTDYDTARKRYEEALPIYIRVGDLLGEGNCILGVGDIARDVGNGDEAEDRYLKALALYDKIPEPYSAGRAHQRLAHIASSEVVRQAQISAAREAWRSIGRDDLIAELDAESAP